MDNDRHALLLGVSTYDAVDYHDLGPVRADLHYMQAVLERTDIGMFNPCTVAAEPTRAEMMQTIEAFLGDRQPSETALVYFSGHGQFEWSEGQLYFITKDTDPQDLAHTAVPADFVQRRLQECRAASKVLLLDCCDSGSAVQSWSAKGVPAQRRAPEGSLLLRPTGVYVITASDALQPASAMAPLGSALGTSRFTGEIVEGLRNGRVKDQGWVTTDDLFTYLVQQMATLPHAQRPTKSTLRATGNLLLARTTARRIDLPAPREAADGGRATPRIPAKSRRLAAVEASAEPGWPNLIGYYLACMAEEAMADTMPIRGRSDNYHLLRTGAEPLQSGARSQFPAPAELSASTGTPKDANREIWYGYPVVSLPGRGSGEVRLAPLLIQQVELTADEAGARVLRPAGVPTIHPGLVAELLDRDKAADLLSGWQPRWQNGNDNQMLQDVRQVMSDLGLAELEPLDTSALQGHSADSSPRTGVHNAAILITSQSSGTATAGLVDELLRMGKEGARILPTALHALTPGQGAQQANPTTGPDPAEVLVVSPGPLNESQEAVVRSAMTRRLTVATGPPGTGKSAVVTSLVATAVAAGESVLVASTNNQAVDEVAERCARIAPGLLIRTGNRAAQEREAELLFALLQPPEAVRAARSGPTIRSGLSVLDGEAGRGRQELADRARAERRLAQVCESRTASAAAAGIACEVLATAWSGRDGELAAWATRARRVATARWFAGRRRKWVTARFAAELDASFPAGPIGSAESNRLGSTPEVLLALADFAENEVELRAGAEAARRAGADRLPYDVHLDIDRRLRDTSAELVRAEVAARVAGARRAIGARRQALQDHKRLQVSQRDLLGRLRGWAGTTHSMRQFALEPQLFDLVVVDEASQCSIPAVLPLLFRAKRCLIIGDAMQLPHIVKVSSYRERQARERNGLSASYLEDHRLSYASHSAFHAAAEAFGEPMLLDEHYRCHPHIAALVNDYCYAGRLRVLTDIRTTYGAEAGTGGPKPGPTLQWAEVTGGVSARGRNGRSWWNRAEVEAVVETVERLLVRLPETATIGVVTPFRAQMEEIARRIHNDRVLVGTVHAFQGSERDAMVLSLVVAENTPHSTTNRVASQVNLWNVAITRARSLLVTVGGHKFWSEQSGLPGLLAQRSLPGHAPEYDFDRRPDPLLTTLHARLIGYGYVALESEPVIEGHPCDFLVTASDGNVAILIDRGTPDGEDPARHLRLLHARADLLVGLPAGGAGATRGPVVRTVRIPRWRLLADAPLPDLTPNDQ